MSDLSVSGDRGGDPVSRANGFLGTPYLWGGNGKSGIDCSGLMCQAYPHLPRTAHDQYKATQRVTADQLQRGDLVFKQGRLGQGVASHVGIYDGQGGVTEAPHSGARVRTTPLAQFTSNGLLGYGRVAMPKTKTRAAKQTVTQAVPMSAGASPASNGDLASFLQGLVAGRPQPMPILRDPNAPSEVPNPGYNPQPQPAGDLAGFFGGGGNSTGLDLAQMFAPAPQVGAGTAARPYDERQTLTQPGLIDQANAGQQLAQQQQPDPFAQLVAEHKAKAGLHKSIAEVLAANPAAQFEMPGYTQAPIREQATIPDRPAPRYDPMTGILATIFGLADPQGAGQYGSQPLQAGVAQAQIETADNQRRYQQEQDQLSREYEDALAERNNRAHYDTAAAGANFSNANARRDAAIAAGTQSAEGGQAGSLADALGLIGEQSKTAGTTALKAQQAQNAAQSILAQNAAQLDYAAKQDKAQNDIYKTLLTTVTRGYGTDERRAVGLDSNQARRDVAAGNNAAHLQGIDAQQAGANSRNDNNNKTKKYLGDNKNATALAVAKYKADKALSRGSKALAASSLPPTFRSAIVGAQRDLSSASHEADKIAGTGVEVTPQLEARISAAQAKFDRAEKAGNDWLAAHPGAAGMPTQPAGGAAGASGARSTPALNPLITGFRRVNK